MNIKKIAIITTVSALIAGDAFANWQYRNGYRGDARYMDNGARMTVTMRGGASLGSAGIQNDIGALSVNYWTDGAGGIVTDVAYQSCVANGGCSGFTYLGSANIGDLPAVEDFSSFGFSGGVGIGFTVPESPQWRIEAAWDTVAKATYNHSPMFEGTLTTTNGDSIAVASSGVNSSIQTDVLSVMAYYDFYDGNVKQFKTFIPYIGFGVGYADSVTELMLSDLYGDLSGSTDLGNYGTANSLGILEFEKSTKNTATVAGLGAVGFSYGLMDNMFVDMGLRVMYIPNADWVIEDDTETIERSWFSAQGLIYTNFMMGIRFEF